MDDQKHDNAIKIKKKISQLNLCLLKFNDIVQSIELVSINSLGTITTRLSFLIKINLFTRESIIELIRKEIDKLNKEFNDL